MEKVLTVAVLAALSLPAFAHNTTPQIDQRQDRQERRIEQGVRSGELTPRERAEINRAQDRQNQLIARLKHNDRALN